MENLIQWLDLKSGTGRSGNGIKDYDFVVYRKLNKPINAGNYISFSDFFTEIYKTTKKIKVGKIGTTLVFHFNDKDGLNLHINKSNTKCRIRVSSKPLVDLIFENLGYDKNKPTNIYTLKDLGNNTFSIDKKETTL